MIVVGVDGSAGAARALEFAVREAELRKSELRVVCAWQAPITAYAGAMIAPAIDPATFASELRQAAQKQVDAALAEHNGVSTNVVLREGNAAAILIDEGHRAELIVIGSRGLGGFAGLLLGSVGHQVAAHAACPVVIVPPAAD
ncbi:MAG TPA: universal stress protein [Gaiellales bacterium]|nr:universal stress protein [Gaiellales bacterium]